MRAPMVRIGTKLDKTVTPHLIDDTLNALPIESHAPRQPRHRLQGRRNRNRAQDLPACAGEAEIGDQPVAGRKQAPVEPEHRKNQLGQGLPPGVCRFPVI